MPLKEKIEDCFHILFHYWKTDDNLKGTPERIAKMWEHEFISHKTKPEMRTFKNRKYDEIIMFDNIPFTGVCPHHLQPYQGKAWFLYIPNQVVVGASKPARLIDYYCSKTPELHEDVGIQIMDDFIESVDPVGALLVMRAIHTCMACRGIKTGFSSGMTTSISRGAFRDKLEVRLEAFSLIRFSQEVRI